MRVIEVRGAEGAGKGLEPHERGAHARRRTSTLRGWQGLAVEADAFFAFGGRRGLVGIDDQQARARAHLRVGHHRRLAHRAAAGGKDVGFHLHRLERRHALAGHDVIADLDREADDHGRPEGADVALGITRHPVQRAVDLDQVRAADP